MLLVQVGAAPALLRNDQDLDHRWLRIRLVDEGKNTGALGAWVTLRAGGHSPAAPGHRHPGATCPQSELPLTFGLGQADSIESIRVTWPDGSVQEVPVPDELDREITVRRGV